VANEYTFDNLARASDLENGYNVKAKSLSPKEKIHKVNLMRSLIVNIVIMILLIGLGLVFKFVWIAGKEGPIYFELLKANWTTEMC